jgi:hypothetical protein
MPKPLYWKGSEPMTFKTKVNAFKRSATWLGPQHGPGVQLLDALAQELDTGKINAGLATAFRQTWKTLLDAKPEGDAVSTDPIDSLIDGLGK